MNPFAKLTATAAVAAGLFGGLTACQTTPTTNADLAAARSTVEQAAANPYAARAAAVELDRAQQALRRAEGAWAEHHDPEETRHLSYLAERRAAVALAVGAQAQAEERMQQAGADRERVRLQARTREAEAAARNAQIAQAQAQAAQAQAQSAQGMAQQQAERAAALQRDLQALQAKSTQRGMVVTLGDVLFATGKATLQPGGQRSAQQLAGVLRQYPERRVLIEGFTDNTGSEQLNLDLSQRRAEAFRQALLSNGVTPERIEVQAHGEALPVADNATAAGRQQNRRVEVLFSDADGHFATR